MHQDYSIETGRKKAEPSGPRQLLVLALLAAAYLYVFPYNANVNNPNENIRFYMTAALAEQGTYRIDDLRRRWGWTNDGVVRDGHYFSAKAPGTSFLGVPGYAVYHWGNKLIGRAPDRSEALWVCRFTGSIVPTLFFLWIFYRWLGRRTEDPVFRDAVFLSVSCGSLLYAYGMMFVSHTMSAAAAFGAFMLLERRGEEHAVRRGPAFMAGFLAASVTLFEYPGLVVSASLTAYALYRLRPMFRFLWFCLGALPPTLLMMHYQWRAFGHPLTPGHRLLETPAFRDLARQGLFGASEFNGQAAVSLLFDPEMGLFPYTPILILAPLGFWFLLRTRGQRVTGLVAAACVVLPWVSISFMNNWRGGWTVGPRYLAVVVPFCAWASIEALNRLGHRFRRLTQAFALGAAGASLIISGVPSAYYPHVPPDIPRPLVHLFWPLIRNGFAPYNAGFWFGWSGALSMLPWALVLLALWLSALKGTQHRWRVATGALALWVFLLIPAIYPWTRTAHEWGHLAFASRIWMPRGHDRAARLESQLHRGQGNPEAVKQALTRTYESLGRSDDAARVGKVSAGRR